MLSMPITVIVPRYSVVDQNLGKGMCLKTVEQFYSGESALIRGDHSSIPSYSEQATLMPYVKRAHVPHSRSFPWNIVSNIFQPFDTLL